MRDRLIEAALAAGADKAVVLPQSKIVLSPSFREICEGNQCGNFGRCWMCPPTLPPIDQAIKQIRGFPQALWYQSIWPLEDSFDMEAMLAAGHLHAQLSQRLQALLSPLVSGPILHLTCGGCHLCPVCAKAEGQPCRQPDKALPSLEAYGVDVCGTTRDTPLDYMNGPCTVTYFGIVLFGCE